MDTTDSGAALPRRATIRHAMDRLAEAIRDAEPGPEIVYAAAALEEIAAALRDSEESGRMNAAAVTEIDGRGYLRGYARGAEDGRRESREEVRAEILAELGIAQQTGQLHAVRAS
jgi:hypothetical protein